MVREVPMVGIELDGPSKDGRNVAEGVVSGYCRGKGCQGQRRVKGN